MEDNEKDDGANGHESAIVIDLGKKNRKKVKKLRRGRGPLLEKVDDAITELQQEGRLSNNVTPVIVVVRDKKKNSIRSLTKRWL